MDAIQLFHAALGGALIGLGAVSLLWLGGRIAGISGIVGGMLSADGSDLGWRVAFVAGLLFSGLVASALAPSTLDSSLTRSSGAIVAAGLLVGFGTRLGNGCTSGHGVCGLARRSPRSLVATSTFMLAGMLMAGAVTHVFGGVL